MNKEKPQPLNEFELWRQIQAELVGREALAGSVEVTAAEPDDLEAAA